MAGYSGTPLVKKLGIKEGFYITFVNAPKSFANELDLPSNVRIEGATRRSLDFVLLFVTKEKELKQEFVHLAAKLNPSGMLWVAWPKKSSGVITDLSFTNVQAIGLAAGLVDVKICAIDAIWSGLKFVIRSRDRAHR